MRFSTVVAVSAATLAGSAVALPAAIVPPAATPKLPAASKPTSTSTPNTPAQLNAVKPTPTSGQSGKPILAGVKPTASPKSNRHPGQLSKKLTGAERGRFEMDAAGRDYRHAMEEYKKAQADLAAARKMEKQAMSDYGLGDIDKGFTRRDLDIEDILDSLAARGFFDEDHELFGRTPGSTTTPTVPVRQATTPTKPANLAVNAVNPPAGGKPGKTTSTRAHPTPTSTLLAKQRTGQPHRQLTAAERGQQDMTLARTDYSAAQKEYKKAQADLAAARKMEKQAMSDYGLGNIDKGFTRRDLDIEDILDSLAARGFFDEDHELFGRTPGSTTTPTVPVRQATTPTKPANLAVNAVNPPASGKPSKTTSTRAHPTPTSTLLAKQRTGQHPKQLTAAERGQHDMTLARTDYTAAQKEYKKAQADLAAARKMEKQAMSDYGLGNIDKGFTRRDLHNVEALMEIIARGYYGADDEY